MGLEQSMQEPGGTHTHQLLLLLEPEEIHIHHFPQLAQYMRTRVLVVIHIHHWQARCKRRQGLEVIRIHRLLQVLDKMVLVLYMILDYDMMV